MRLPAGLKSTAVTLLSYPPQLSSCGHRAGQASSGGGRGRGRHEGQGTPPARQPSTLGRALAGTPCRQAGRQAGRQAWLSRGPPLTSSCTPVAACFLKK